MNRRKLSTGFFFLLALACWGYGIFTALKMGTYVAVLSVIVPPFGMLLGVYSGGAELFSWLASFATWRS